MKSLIKNTKYNSGNLGLMSAATTFGSNAALNVMILKSKLL